jgi:hypothetical protein
MRKAEGESVLVPSPGSRIHCPGPFTFQPIAMRNKRVVIYGGTDLDKQPTGDFVSALAYALLDNDSILLATGGFARRAASAPRAISTDVAAADGARKFAAERGIPLEECLETWLPEHGRDRLDEEVERFEAGKSQVLIGLSAQARRMRLVQIADAIVTIRGEVRTALVLELALALAKPAVPVPFTGGDSREHWDDNPAYYPARLGITSAQADSWKHFDLDAASFDAVRERISEIVGVVNRVLRRNCLVLMPFKDEFLDEFAQLQQVIDDNRFHPVRLDRELYTGDVRDTVSRLLLESDAVVADVTTLSANVMYEVGLAHASGRKPLLLWRGDSETMEKRLPFYLRPQRIVCGSDEDLLEAVARYLGEVTAGREPH